jgi:hypothetical protein
MSLDISWLIDKRVIFIRVGGDIDVEAIKHQAELVSEYRSQGIQPVHVIVDARKITKIPLSPGKIKEMGFKSDVGGWKIIITNSAVIRYLASLMTQLIGLEYRFFETPEAAIAYLYELEPELQQLQLNNVMVQF